MADIGRVCIVLPGLDRTDILQSAQQVLHLQEEIKLHVEFCREYGLSDSEIENQEEDQGKPNQNVCPTPLTRQFSMYCLHKVPLSRSDRI